MSLVEASLEVHSQIISMTEGENLTVHERKLTIANQAADLILREANGLIVTGQSLGIAMGFDEPFSTGNRIFSEISAQLEPISGTTVVSGGQLRLIPTLEEKVPVVAVLRKSISNDKQVTSDGYRIDLHVPIARTIEDSLSLGLLGVGALERAKTSSMAHLFSAKPLEDFINKTWLPKKPYTQSSLKYNADYQYSFGLLNGRYRDDGSVSLEDVASLALAKA